MPVWEQIAILGVGLIGGSIGQAVRCRALAKRVVGWGRSSQSLELAKELGAIDEGTSDLAAAVSQASLVIIATPVDRIIEQVKAIQKIAPPSTLITDAGSTKQVIVDALAKSDPQQACFIGSHPLAGGERSGVQAASPDLFVGKCVVVTPTPDSPQHRVAEVCEFWQALGAKTRLMPAAVHDQIVARTSHAPHCVASALAAATPAEHLPLAASGWRDSTRVAAGDAELWTEILKQNSEPVLQALDAVQLKLQDLIEAIREGDWNAVTNLLKEGKERRDALGS